MHITLLLFFLDSERAGATERAVKGLNNIGVKTCEPPGAAEVM